VPPVPSVLSAPTLASPPYPSRSSALAMAALAVAGLIYGYNWVVMKTALNYADPSVFAALRVFLGAVFLFLLLAIFRRSMRPPNPVLTLVVGCSA
jgi:drug/metabolite transporter (DMT)-like permease